MRDRRERWTWTWGIVTATALATIGAALAQDLVPEPNPKGAAARETGRAKAKGKGKAHPAGPVLKGGGLIPGAPPARRKGHAGVDPLPPPAAAKGLAPVVKYPFKYRVILESADGTPLATSFYPSKDGPKAPVVLLVHDKGGQPKDFEDPIDDLKGRSLAEQFQDQAYAVLVVDLRGQRTARPGTPRAGARLDVGPSSYRANVEDLQAAYQFLVGCHNRQELNLSKFAVVALGEGANLAAAWAASPGGAVASEGRVSDLNALVLVSPLETVQDVRFKPTLAILAPRLPILLVAGKTDPISAKPVEDVEDMIKRNRFSSILYFPTLLHGAKLIRFAPGVPTSILTFLENNIKSKVDEWEPRYNLTPVAYLVEGDPIGRKAATKAALKKAEPAKKDEAAKKDLPAKKAPPE